MLDQAFDALKTYDWGADRGPLNPIEDAVVSTDPAVRKEVETRLIAVLKSNDSRDAKDFACRKLLVVGTTASVPTLAEFLGDKEYSHMSRYVLERMQSEESLKALRDALPKVSGLQKAGVISSLGVRGDKDSVPALATLVGDADAAIACAAACALGDIGTAEASKALAEAKPASAGAKAAVVDSTLACAEDLLAAGNKEAALTAYKSLAGEGQPKHIRLAATRGMLACAGKKS